MGKYDSILVEHGIYYCFDATKTNFKPFSYIIKHGEKIKLDKTVYCLNQEDFMKLINIWNHKAKFQNSDWRYET